MHALKGEMTFSVVMLYQCRQLKVKIKSKVKNSGMC